MSKVIAGNGRPVVTWWYEADGYARGLAGALARVFNTFSPASRGPAGTRLGLDGYGVNRAQQWTAPLQNFRGVTQPLRSPESLRLGLGAGVSGQPGLPSTGGPVDSLALISTGQYGAGLGV
ncbi:MAG TPA: hypothetical protein VFE14_20960 [Micromonosporaceae bacterium]|jgi:hypothetical protein|nr:hypothetical protein [Micromonosporaceae bacterium]